MHAGTILIIDDEVETLTAVKIALNRAEWEVLTAKNGMEGLMLSESRKPDVVLLDVSMPDMDGYTVCRRIRRMHEELPILFLTCHSDGEHRKRAIDAGATDYLIKPISPSLLRTKVQEFSGR